MTDQSNLQKMQSGPDLRTSLAAAIEMAEKYESPPFHTSKSLEHRELVIFIRDHGSELAAMAEEINRLKDDLESERESMSQAEDLIKQHYERAKAAEADAAGLREALTPSAETKAAYMGG